jgi:hypothetical protein
VETRRQQSRRTFPGAGRLSQAAAGAPTVRGFAPGARRATLETINGKGVAVMESQIVVDHTEVDGNGFLIGGASNESNPMDELWAQIRSLERRANSRDSEALKLDESAEGERIYLLRLESRELRHQAQALKKKRADLMTSELANRSDAQSFVQFAVDPTTE